ncbi:hypothetical protein [Amycolatopsis sp. WQ 127309]|uniref:hypothetical protein n=1 Tax=Amycolatopsis sp. WQ 127309 TaxID=2932773 RepID=UPI001FF23DD5|nr:hypothetical protein [Amycolatopsis sp. WQ 127309]UOZ05548.1 hypothetical protein MUY22_43090 [Amycolatopsis sp. WQ 127309]
MSPAVAGHHSATTAAMVRTAITAAVSHIVLGDSSGNRPGRSAATGGGGSGDEVDGVASSVMFVYVAGADPDVADVLGRELVRSGHDR